MVSTKRRVHFHPNADCFCAWCCWEICTYLARPRRISLNLSDHNIAHLVLDLRVLFVLRHVRCAVVVTVVVVVVVVSGSGWGGVINSLPLRAYLRPTSSNRAVRAQASQAPVSIRPHPANLHCILSTTRTPPHHTLLHRPCRPRRRRHRRPRA